MVGFVRKYPVRTAIGTATVITLGVVAGISGRYEKATMEPVQPGAAVTAPAEVINPVVPEMAEPTEGPPEPPLETMERGLYELDIVDMPSPNYNDAKDREIRYIVLHTTEGSFEGAVSWLRDPESKASAHYVVSKKGEITRLVDEEDIAWHVHNKNQDKLGIEMEGTYAKLITGEQREKVGMLVLNLMRRYDIPIENVVAHSSLDAKLDPGEQNMRAVLEYVRAHGSDRLRYKISSFMRNR